MMLAVGGWLVDGWGSGVVEWLVCVGGVVGTGFRMLLSVLVCGCRGVAGFGGLRWYLLLSGDGDGRRVAVGGISADVW
jgi:hypothetical protein